MKVNMTANALQFMLLLMVVAGCCAYDRDLEAPRSFSLLRVVEQASGASARALRGASDALALTVGGTTRIIGGSFQQMGGGIEGLSDAVEGDRSRTAGDDDDRDPIDALRSVASRPIRVIGRVMRSLGDTTNFIGDTAEKVTGEAIAILPDTVRIFESSVRTLREKIGDMDAPVEDTEPEVATRLTGLTLRRLEEGSGSDARAAQASTTDETSPPSSASKAHGGQTGVKSRWRGRLASSFGISSVQAARGLQSHALFALVTVALGARSMGRIGMVLLILLALLYLAQIETLQRESLGREVAAQERHAVWLAALGPMVEEPCAWLNALVASGWESTIRAYATDTAVEVCRACRAYLPLHLPPSSRAHLRPSIAAYHDLSRPPCSHRRVLRRATVDRRHSRDPRAPKVVTLDSARRARLWPTPAAPAIGGGDGSARQRAARQCLAALPAAPLSLTAHGHALGRCDGWASRLRHGGRRRSVGICWSAWRRAWWQHGQRVARQRDGRWAA